MLVDPDVTTRCYECYEVSPIYLNSISCGMKSDLADGQTLKEMFVSGTAWLDKSAPDINAINVLPVPDGDSQFFRGLARGLEGKISFSGKDFATALAPASQAAYRGIANPVEGTFLTLLKDASKPAHMVRKPVVMKLSR